MFAEAILKEINRLGMIVGSKFTIDARLTQAEQEILDLVYNNFTAPEKKTFLMLKQFVSKADNQSTGTVIMTAIMLICSMVRRLFTPEQSPFSGHSNALTLTTAVKWAYTRT